MAAEGWRYGERYDEGARTHDALRAFEQLDADDRRMAVEDVRARELVDLLESAIEYPRGPDREFLAREMRVGLPVGLVTPGAQDRVIDRGVVESWEVDGATGVLRLIRVRWADGELSEHHPAARELSRV